MSMASDGKDNFGFHGEASLNYKASGSPPPRASTWQSAVVADEAMNVHEASLRVPTSSESHLSSSFLSLGWEPSMDNSIPPFQSSFGSMLNPCPPVTSDGNSIAMTELIGRLGANLSSPGGGGGSTMESVVNLATAWNRLNSSPNLNLEVDPSKGAFSMQGGTIVPPHSLAQFSSDPGFAERAARFSCFGNRNYSDLAIPFNFPEAEPPFRSSRTGNCQIPTMPDNLKGGLAVNLSNMGETKETTASEPTQNGIGTDMETKLTDRKVSRLSRSSTPVSTPVSTDDIRHRVWTSGNESDEAELSTGREETSSSDHVYGGDPASSSKGFTEINGRKRKVQMFPKAKPKDAPSPGGRETKNQEAEESQAKRHKLTEAASSKEKDDSKSKAEQTTSENTSKRTKDNVKPPEPPKDYIHVRARRGQATDSHSLAERVRREKISERMKFLQDLVPGCSKVTGKAVMLDEIINYVQSLQRQVEFLSMKLATVNPRLDFNMEGLIAKDMLQSRGSSSRMLFGADTNPAFHQLHQPQQGPVQIGMACGTEGHGTGNPVETALRRTMNAQLPCMDGYGDSIPQIANIWDEDLQSVVQMGFGQNKQSPLTSQVFHGSLPTSHMKIEL